MSKSKDYELAIKIAGEVEKSFYESTKLTKKELQDIAKQAATTATATSESSVSMTEKFKKGLKDAEPAFSGLEKAAKASFKVIAAAAAATGGAIVAVGAKAISVGSEFESQMANVQAITGATGNDFDSLKAKAEELGASTSFTATEVGQAMEYMGMAGWETGQILSGVAGVMQLAAASGEDLATVSDIVTDDMTAFGISLKDIPTEEAEAKVNHFTDVLAAAATSANTNVSMMGETFKYAGPLAGAMGYSVDDLAVATGLMANSSIKASDAGTSLRNIFTRLAKPTKESQDAIDKLGLSLTKEDGTMRSWMEIMEQMREGFQGMTETEKTFYAAELAGQKGMSGLLAIVNASEDDFVSLSNAIENCAGAAERMQDIKLDTLTGDIDIFKSAMDGMYLEIYNQINNPLRETVQIGTELTNGVAEKLANSRAIEKFFGDAQKKLPTAIRQFREAGDAIHDSSQPFLQVGGWLLDNPGVIVGTITAVGTALGVYKIANGAMEIAAALGALGPVGWTIMGIGAAAGVITGIGTAVKKSAAEAKKANLDKHFGNISLSLEDLQKTASFIVKNKSLDKIRESIAAMGELDGISDEISSAAEELNKTNWKVSIGMELTDEEKSDYKNQVQSFVSSTQEYLTQRQYAVTMSVSTLLGDDLESSNVVTELNDFYAGKQKELADLGTQLNEAVTEAFQDGLLDIDEVQEIASLQEQIAHIKSALAGSDFEAGLDLIGTKYAGQALDADSFQNLQAEIQNQMNEAMEAYDEAYKTSMSEYRLMLSEGEWSQEEFDVRSEELNAGYLQQKADIQAKAVQFQVDTIRQAYGEELDDLIAQLGDETGAQLTDMLNHVAYEGGPNVHLDWLAEDIIDSVEIDRSTKDALADLYEQLQPAMEQMQGLAQQYRDAGKTVPESLKEGLSDMGAIGALAGDGEAMWEVIGKTAEAEEYQNVLKTIDEAGGYMPEQLANSLAENQYKIDAAVEQSLRDTQMAYQSLYGQNWIDVPINFRVKNKVSLNAPYSNDYYEGNVDVGHAKGGIFDTPHIAWFAEAGPEAAIPLDGSRNAIDLWEKTGELLGMDGITGGPQPISEEIENAAYCGNQEQSIQFVYNPTMQFYGEAPSKEDLMDVQETGQEKFNRMMEQWVKDNGRLLFHG